MAIQRWTIAKIGGASAIPLRKVFDRWSRQTLKMEQSVETKWPKSEVTKMATLAAGLRFHAKELPILFYSEHIDMWSVGASLFRYLGQPLKEIRFVNAAFLMACIDCPGDGRVLQALQKALRRRHIQQAQEDRWFLNTLVQAMRTWEKLIPDSAVIIIRESFTISPTEDEVVAGCKMVPSWLNNRTSSPTSALNFTKSSVPENEIKRASPPRKMV